MIQPFGIDKTAASGQVNRRVEDHTLSQIYFLIDREEHINTLPRARIGPARIGVNMRENA